MTLDAVAPHPRPFDSAQGDNGREVSPPVATHRERMGGGPRRQPPVVPSAERDLERGPLDLAHDAVSPNPRPFDFAQGDIGGQSRRL